MVEEAHHYDVLIVGAGNAACSAAHAALDKKASVGILEKAAKNNRGGNSALSGAMRFVYNGVEDVRRLVKNPSDADIKQILDRLPERTEADLWDELMRVTNNQSDQDMLQVHVTESRQTVQWLASKGHDWVPAGGSSLHSGNTLLMNGGGYGLQQRNFAILERGGVTFHYETSAIGLMQDQQGRVTGVQALTPTGFATFHARATVLACGGFEANPEMRTRYLGPGWDLVKVRGVPFNTGDGLRMALDIGAMPHGSWSTCHASPQDINLPPFSVPSAFGLRDFDRYMYPYSIMVNVHGHRFTDEGEDLRSRTYAKMGRAILAQPGGVAFQIMDAQVHRLGIYPANYDKATTVKADTLEKIAEELEINPANFLKTVQEFNAAILPEGTFNPSRYRLDGKRTAGITPPKSNYCLSITEPPFEAWPVRCGITFTFGGLKIDPRTGEVQHVAGRPIAGLYAAGEIAGGLFVGSYASGSSIMAGATFGRLAGTHAALNALQH